MIGDSRGGQGDQLLAASTPSQFLEQLQAFERVVGRATVSARAPSRRFGDLPRMVLRAIDPRLTAQLREDRIRYGEITERSPPAAASL